MQNLTTSLPLIAKTKFLKNLLLLKVRASNCNGFVNPSSAYFFLSQQDPRPKSTQKHFSGRAECNFDNTAEICLANFRKVIAQSPRKSLEIYSFSTFLSRNEALHKNVQFWQPCEKFFRLKW